MMEQWLEKLVDGWKTKDIDQVLSLFSSDVEYWETPYKKLNSITEVQNEWEAIRTQDDIQIETKIIMNQDKTHLVQWKLRYIKEGSLNKWAGLYIIKLNEVDKCSYFYQVGEEQK